MGINTKGRLIGNVNHNEVLNFIRQKIDTEAESYVNFCSHGIISNYDWVKKVYDESNVWKIWDGFIQFSYNGHNRSLHYNYSNVNSYEHLEYYQKFNLSDMVKSETTYISLRCDDDAIEIIKMIVSHFGGWIDENDCDNEEYYPINKNPDGSVMPIIRVTMQDIYDKFGGTVIITDL